MWASILIASLGTYVEKLLGYLLPQRNVGTRISPTNDRLASRITTRGVGSCSNIRQRPSVSHRRSGSLGWALQ